MTALTDDCLNIYPLAVWEDIENRVHSLGSMNPLKRKFLTRANRYGAEVEMDAQGRILLKPNQRRLVGITDEIVLIGHADHLQLHAAQQLDGLDGVDSFSDDEFDALGI